MGNRLKSALSDSNRDYSAVYKIVNLKKIN